MDDLITRQSAIDTHCELCVDRVYCNVDICPDVEAFQLIPLEDSDLITKQSAIDAIKSIKNRIWDEDIPSPGSCPEYIELHQKMVSLMHMCDIQIEAFERSK